jgi:hypothetical protein
MVTFSTGGVVEPGGRVVVVVVAVVAGLFGVTLVGVVVEPVVGVVVEPAVGVVVEPAVGVVVWPGAVTDPTSPRTKRASPMTARAAPTRFIGHTECTLDRVTWQDGRREHQGRGCS